MNAMSTPRYMGIPTFMRAPIIENLSDYDIAMVGVPYDGAVTNRPGARHGPREVRSASSMMRAIHPTTRLNPYETCRVGDGGELADPRHRCGEVKFFDLNRVVRGVRVFAREHVIEQQPEQVHVGSRVHRLAENLFRSHCQR